MSAASSSPPRRPLGAVNRSTNHPPACTAPAAASVNRPNPYPRAHTPYVPSPHVKSIVTQISKNRWGVDKLRDRQAICLSTLFHSKQCDGRVLFVDVTGGGKSHVMRVAGTCVRGIILVTCPTLALAADVLKKFQVANPSIGAVKAIHFDEEINTPQQLHDLNHDLRQMNRDTTTTVFLFISPQKLAKHKDIRKTLFACNHRGVFHMILIDEFHMHCQHGIDFRHEIKAVFNEFVRPLMLRKNAPYLMACTATCSMNNINAFKQMTGVSFTRDNYVWSPPTNFRQRHINMNMEISSTFTTSSSNRILDFVKSNDTAAFAVFSNTAAMASKLYSHAEDALNKAAIVTDVVLVHGSLSPQEKFYLTRAFCQISTSTTSKHNVRGLFGTSASDTGLDHPYLLMGYAISYPTTWSSRSSW
eukprot:scaffold38634_cov61-Cyclotella_meneghiniana.AAC.5